MMKQSRTVTLAILALATVTITGVTATTAQAAPATTVTLRAADLDLSQTRATGHVEFLKSGLHVWTESNTSTDKAAGYFAVTGPLPDAAALDWFGTDPQPGSQLVFDADGTSGNGNDYNILVGEPVYGDSFWLTNSSSADAKAADPSGAENGGNGSEWFGTLAEWKAALPNARILAAGFSLGSGIKGDGVVDSITLDGTRYEFTNEPVAPEPAVADVDGTFKVVKKDLKVSIVLKSMNQPADSVIGDKLTWKILVDGRVALRATQGFAERDVWVRTFDKGTRNHVVQLVKNKELVRTVIVRTGTVR